MFFNVFNTLALCSAMLALVNASGPVPRSILKLEEPIDSLLVRRQGGGVGAAVNAQVMVQGWASVNSVLSQCQSTFQQATSIQVAVQAAVHLSTTVQAAASQYGQCACGNDPSAYQVQASFQTIMVNFFTTFQATLYTGQARFGAMWQSQFQALFQQCSSGIQAFGGISAALQIDLRAVLQQAHVDAKLFASVGINLSVLLGLHVGIGGLVNL